MVEGDQLRDFCPRCGEARIGAFRFCTGCQLDFDAIGATPGAPADTLPAAVGRSASRFSRRGVISLGVAVVVGLAAIGSVQGTESTRSNTALATATPTARTVLCDRYPDRPADAHPGADLRPDRPDHRGHRRPRH